MTADNVITIEQLEINLTEQRVRRGAINLHLGRKEWALLEILLLNRNHVLTHRQLLQHVWGAHYERDSSYLLHVAIGRLREKLGDKPPRYILAEADLGYRFVLPTPNAPIIAIPEPSLALAVPITYTNIPAPLNAFIGREHEQHTLGQLLRQPHIRLMSILGTGGVGKTRLVLQTALQWLPLFHHGVHVVDLAALRDPDLFVNTIMQSLGIKTSNQSPLLKQLKDFLHDKQLLLILDNFEQLLEAAPLVTDLLAHAPQLKVVTTSREALNIYGEQRFELLPFAVDFDHLSMMKQQLLQQPAISLFLARAQAVQASLNHETDGGIIVQICQRLDGLALAIELAASRSNIFPLPMLLERLTKRLAFINNGPRDVPARHQTLQAVIEWSYLLLNPREQALFSQLAVFSGIFDLQAVLGVFSSLEHSDLELIVFSLVQKHLLQYRESDQRFYFLETIREYAEQQLNERPDAACYYTAYIDYYRNFVQAHSHELTGSEQQHWMQQFQAHYANIRAAIGYSLKSGALASAAHLGAMLWNFWNRADMAQEGSYWIQQILGHADQIDPNHRIMMLRGLSTFMRNQGDFPQAQQYLAQGLTIARQEQRDDLAMGLLNGIGLLYKREGLFEQAAQAFTEAIQLARHFDKIRDLAAILSNLGEVRRSLEQYQQSQSDLQESLVLAQQVHDHHMAANILNSLGLLAYDTCDYQQAHDYYQQGLNIHQQLQNKRGIALICTNLADSLTKLKQFNQANAYYEQALTNSYRIADPYFICHITIQKAWALLQQADYPQSRQLLIEAIKLAFQHEFIAHSLRAILELTEWYVAQQQWQNAAWMAGFMQQRAAEYAYLLDGNDRRQHQARLIELQQILAEYDSYWQQGLQSIPEQVLKLLIVDVA
ncbi:ATP-binding protein [Herpetosiphon llansteffanensis]|uniref:ATP-binding protein n=1 Tax=Herpetosiphon llansteffanensis TaxID=2094568 RepID=UPI0013E00D1A|nr:tetratricopeptide repeat protein [Herpetosiphon llansteffanensis]